MADSTQPMVAARPGAAVTSRATGVAGHDIPSAGACRDVVRVARKDTHALADLMVQQALSAPRRQPRDDEALADAIRRTVKAIARAGATGAPPRTVELAAFRVLGVRWCAGGFTLDQVLDQVHACAMRVGTALMQRSEDVDPPSTADLLVPARSAMSELAEAMTRLIQQELTAGYAAALAWKEPKAERVDLVRAALDDPGWDDSAVPRQARIEDQQSVAVLRADGPDSLQRLELAAHDAAVLIPTAVDAGTGERPPHRRVVFAVWSRQTRRDAATVLAAIGERHNVAIHTTPPAPGLLCLRSAYHVLLEGLPRDAARATLPGRNTIAASPA
jgi:hypothetical protein